MCSTTPGIFTCSLCFRLICWSLFQVFIAFIIVSLGQSRESALTHVLLGRLARIVTILGLANSALLFAINATIDASGPRMTRPHLCRRFSIHFLPLWSICLLFSRSRLDSRIFHHHLRASQPKSLHDIYHIDYVHPSDNCLSFRPKSVCLPLWLESWSDHHLWVYFLFRSPLSKRTARCPNCNMLVNSCPFKWSNIWNTCPENTKCMHSNFTNWFYCHRKVARSASITSIFIR